MRILQVREQDKINAARRREAYRQKKNSAKQRAMETMRSKWEKVQEEKVSSATTKMTATLVSIGQAHRSAMRVAEQRHNEMKRSEKLETALRKIEKMRQGAALGRAKKELDATTHHVRRRHGAHREEVRRKTAAVQRGTAHEYQQDQDVKKKEERAMARELRLKAAEQDLMMFVAGRADNTGPTLGDCQTEPYAATVVRHGPLATTGRASGFHSANAQSKAAKEKAKVDNVLARERKLAAFARGKKAGHAVAMEKDAERVEQRLELISKAERAEKAKEVGIRAKKRAAEAKIAKEQRRHEAELEREFERIFLGGAPANSRSQPPAQAKPSVPEPQKRRRRRWSEDEQEAIKVVDAYLGEEGKSIDDGIGISAFAAKEAPAPPPEHLTVDESAPDGNSAVPFLDEETAFLDKDAEALEEALSAPRSAGASQCTSTRGCS